jgi:AcrR family transcriptional regulator
MVRVLSTAEERREAVLRAAEEVFVERGIHGTPTTAVAKAAGISHAYLFRLFPTKSDLVVALGERCHGRILEAFAAAAAGAHERGDEVIPAMGEAYGEIARDQSLLLLQLQLQAAGPSMPEVQACNREGFKRLVDLVRRESGAPDEDVKNFFAHGMLINVVGAMGAAALDEDWAKVLRGEDC